MRKSGYTSFVAVLLFLGTAASVQAQATKFAQAGMGFLKIDVAADVAALGGTHIGTTGRATAMFSNPAAMALLEGGDVTAGVTDWIADIKLYGLAAAYRIGDLGVFGINIVAMDYGTFRGTRPWQNGDDPGLRDQGFIDLGGFEVGEFAVGVSYARQITGQFYVGGNVRYAHQDLGAVQIIDAFTGNVVDTDNSINSIVFDFGTMYYPGFKDLRFGASVRNFSNQNDYFDQRFELPLTLDFGIAMNVLTLFGSAPGPENSHLMLAVDWVHPRDFSERLHLGLEYGFLDTVFLRGGYKFNYDEESFTGGLGVRLESSGYGIRADYAYGAFGDFFGSVIRLTLSILLR